ncbi:MAG: hypothetical protein Q4F53_02735 [Nesterenkonia sp.]|uniref:lipopolysaccharide biosynthesis protein n=1 Tax=Nesterenkonia marinintestina TaxID=2979865 RepID=UPI0021C0C4DC|nr:hypothetical protein [Nesterenkonia sp. GX14115]MDO5492514.1 hypothetical protein [Nesterenkonia sp.]
MPERSWLGMFLRTAGLRLAVLPLSALLVLTAAGLTMHYAGAAAFGLITLVSQLRMALPFTDLGMGAAVTRAVAQGRDAGASARRETALLIRRTVQILTVIGIAGAVVAVGLGFAGAWSAAFRAPDSLAADVDAAMTVVLVVFFLSLPIGIAERVLIGLDRSDLVVIYGLVPALGNVVYVFLAGSAGVAPMWLAMGLPLGSLVFLLVCWRAAFRQPDAVGLRPGLHPGGLLRAQEGPPVGPLLLGGVPVVLATAGMVLAEQHGRFVLAAAASPEVLSEYALGLQLYMPIFSVLYMAATVFWPRFAAGGDRTLWLRANMVLVGFGLAAAMGYLVFARPVAAIVSRSELELSWTAVVCFSAALVAQSAHLTQVNLLTDRSGFWKQAAMNLSVLVLIVPVTLLGLSLGLGAAAPAASMVLCVLCAQVVPGLLIGHRRTGAHTSSRQESPVTASDAARHSGKVTNHA